MNNTSEMEAVESPKRQREEQNKVESVPKKRKVKKSQSLESIQPSPSSSSSLSPPPRSRSNAKTRSKAKTTSENSATLEDNTIPKVKPAPKAKGPSKAKGSSDVSTRANTRIRTNARRRTSIRSSSEVAISTPEPEPIPIPPGPPKPRNPAHLTMIPLEIFHKILTEMTRTESHKQIDLRKPETFNHYFHLLKSTCWKLRKEVDQYIGIKLSTWEDWGFLIVEPRNYARSESTFHYKDPRYMLQEEGNYDLEIENPILVHNKKIGTYNPESTWFKFRWDNSFVNEAHMDRIFNNIIDPNNLLDKVENLTLEFPIARLKEELYSGGPPVPRDWEMPDLLQEGPPPRNFPELGHFTEIKNLNIIIQHDKKLPALSRTHYIQHEKTRLRVYEERLDLARRLLGRLYELLVRRRFDLFTPMPLKHVKMTGTTEVHIGPEDNRWTYKIPLIRVFEKFKEGSLPAGHNILRLVNDTYMDPDGNFHLVSMDLY